MKINYDKEHLQQIIEDFSNIIGYKIQIISSDFKVIASASKGMRPFCKYIASCPEFSSQCAYAINALIEKYMYNPSLTTNVCHMGFTDSVYPIVDENTILGYIQFGPIRTSKSFSEIEHLFDGTSVDKAKAKKLFYETACIEKKRIESINRLASLIASHIIMGKLIVEEGNNTTKIISDYIIENITTPLTIEKICKALNLSKSTLYAHLGTSTGYTVNEFITNHRIERAKYLLRHTDKRLGEICNEIGLTDTAYFCKLFKKRTTYSPIAFRKMFR